MQTIDNATREVADVRTFDLPSAPAETMGLPPIQTITLADLDRAAQRARNLPPSEPSSD